jgi:hypothetical protein
VAVVPPVRGGPAEEAGTPEEAGDTRVAVVVAPQAVRVIAVVEVAVGAEVVAAGITNPPSHYPC